MSMTLEEQLESVRNDRDNQADEIDQLTAIIAKLQREADESRACMMYAIGEMSKWAREAGFAQGQLEMLRAAQK